MHNLFAVYDLTNYNTYSAIGIAISFVAAGIILFITVVAYRRAVARERTADSPPDIPRVDLSPPQYSASEAVTDAGDNAVIGEPSAETAATISEDANDVKAATPECDADTATVTKQAAGSGSEETGQEAPPASESEPAATAENARMPEFVRSIMSEMSDEARTAFTYAVVDNACGLDTKVGSLGNYADETAFLRDFFRSSGKYKNILPTSAYEVLYARYAPYLTSDTDRTRLNGKLIGAYYSRRKVEADALDKCERLCREDVEFNLSVRKVTAKRVPSVKRLIIIYAARGKFAEAIALCDRAIGQGIIDRKSEGYGARREKLVARLEKQQKREERARAKREKAERKAAAASAARAEHTEVSQ